MFEVDQSDPAAPAWRGPERRSGKERRQASDRREQIRFDLTKGDRRCGNDRRRRDLWAGSSIDRW